MKNKLDDLESVMFYSPYIAQPVALTYAFWGSFLFCFTALLLGSDRTLEKGQIFQVDLLSACVGKQAPFSSPTSKFIFDEIKGRQRSEDGFSFREQHKSFIMDKPFLKSLKMVCYVGL